MIIVSLKDINEYINCPNEFVLARISSVEYEKIKSIGYKTNIVVEIKFFNNINESRPYKVLKISGEGGWWMGGTPSSDKQISTQLSIRKIIKEIERNDWGQR